MLEEVVKLVSPGPVGAAKLDEDDEMAKVAKRIEELEGNFMIKGVDDEEIKTSTSGKDGYDESWERKKRMSTSGKWKKLYSKFILGTGSYQARPKCQVSRDPRIVSNLLCWNARPLGTFPMLNIWRVDQES